MKRRRKETEASVSRISYILEAIVGKGSGLLPSLGVWARVTVICFIVCLLCSQSALPQHEECLQLAASPEDGQQEEASSAPNKSWQLVASAARLAEPWHRLTKSFDSLRQLAGGGAREFAGPVVATLPAPLQPTTFKQCKCVTLST